jgi:chaperonin GroES
MSVRPLEDRIYVQRGGSWEDLQDRGGLIVYEEKPPLEIGEVVAVGPGRWEAGRRVPVPVKVGARILFGRYAGVDYGEDHVFLKPDEVLGVVGAEA